LIRVHATDSLLQCEQRVLSHVGPDICYHVRGQKVQLSIGTQRVLEGVVAPVRLQGVMPSRRLARHEDRSVWHLWTSGEVIIRLLRHEPGVSVPLVASCWGSVWECTNWCERRTARAPDECERAHRSTQPVTHSPSVRSTVGACRVTAISCPSSPAMSRSVPSAPNSMYGLPPASSKSSVCCVPRLVPSWKT